MLHKHKARLVGAALLGAVVISATTLMAIVPGAGAAGAPIKIGLILPLSGPEASVGQENLGGAQAAVAYVNAHGGILGRKVQLLQRDSAASPTQAALAARSLQGAGVAGIVGDILDADVIAEEPIVDSAHIPTIAWAEAYNNATNYPYLWGYTYTIDTTTQTYANYLVKTRGISKVGILYLTGAYGQGGDTAATAALKSLGDTPVGAVSFPTGAPDVSAELQQLKSDGAQGLLVYAYGPDLVTVIRDMNAINWSPSVVTAPSLAFASSIQAMGSASLSNVYGGPVAKALLVKTSVSPPTAQVQLFLKWYLKVTHANTFNGGQTVAISIWDATMNLMTAIKRAGSTSPSAVEHQFLIAYKHPFQAAQGKFAYSATNHDPITSAAYGLVQGGVQCVSTCLAAPGS